MQQSWITAAALAATVVVGANASAQTPTPTPERPRPPAPAPADPARPQPPAATATRAAADQEFVTKATESGFMEVELGKLAGQKAANVEVKAFAARMVTDHGKSTAELTALTNAPKPPADKITPPAALASLTGVEFDRAYMTEMVSMHTKSVALYETQSRDGQDPALKRFATEKLPTVKDHLEKARALHAKLGTTTE
jgi:putative membrane protein